MNETVVRRVAWAAAVGGSTVAALSLALPWGASGRRWRSAFSLLRLARELEIAEGPLVTGFAICITLTPVLAGAAWVAAALRQRALTGVLAGGVAILTLLTAYAVLRSPLRPGAGLVVGSASAFVALTGVATLVASPVSRGP